MGRILRYSLAEGDVTAVDFSFRTPGKLLIHPVSNDIRIAYDRSDANTATGVNYFTLFAGVQYTFDIGQGVGFLAQNQNLFLVCPTGTTVVEIWYANER